MVPYFAASRTGPPSYSIQEALQASKDGPVVKQLVVLVLVSSTIVLAAVAIGLPRILRRRRRRRRQRPSGLALLTAEESSKQKEVARYNNIENWIVSKRIHPHDDLCAKCLGLPVLESKSDSELKDPEAALSQNRKRSSTEPLFDLEDDDESSLCSSQNNNSSSNESSDEHHVRECSICFEKLLVNEIASWSPDPDCHHVFHHTCIKEWLLHNSGCPSCRATFLPVDRRPAQKSKISSFKQIAELVYAQQQRSRYCYYCVQHGVVYEPCNRILKSRLPCSAELDRIQTRGRQVPSKEELVETRGAGRREQDNINDNDDDDDQVHDDQDLLLEESPACGTTINCSTMITLDAPSAAATAQDDDDKA